MILLSETSISTIIADPKRSSGAVDTTSTAVATNVATQTMLEVMEAMVVIEIMVSVLGTRQFFCFLVSLDGDCAY